MQMNSFTFMIDASFLYKWKSLSYKRTQDLVLSTPLSIRRGGGGEASLTLELFYTQASFRQLLNLRNNASEVLWTGMTG